MALRPNGAGAQLLLLALLARAGIALETLERREAAPARPGPTSRRRCARGRADCGIATRSVALAAGLDFVPLTWERFDLVLRQRDYFLPGPQALFGFLRPPVLRERAAELGGYDVGEWGGAPSQLSNSCFDAFSSREPVSTSLETLCAQRRPGNHALKPPAQSPP